MITKEKIQVTELIFLFYYFFNIAIGFVIYGFWKGLLYMMFPIAPFIYIVERFLKFN